jgi:hypothetical protein
MPVIRVWLSAAAVSIGLIFPVRGADPTTTMNAMGKVLGAAEESMAILNHCGEVDPANKDVYDDLSLRVIALYQPYYERAETILPAEGIKSGFPDGNKFRGAFLSSLRDAAQTEIRKVATTLTSEQDIASCQHQRSFFQQNKGMFTPPSSHFPMETRVIDEGR